MFRACATMTSRFSGVEAPRQCRDVARRCSPVLPRGRRHGAGGDGSAIRKWGAVVAQALRSLSLATLVLVPATALAGDFVDTRMVISFGDDNLLAGPGETEEFSPRAGFGERGGDETFFDNLDTRDSGDETQAHLVVYRKDVGFSPCVLTEAALVLQWAYMADERTGSTKFDLRDDGSYLKLTWFLEEQGNDDYALALTAFPFDTNRFRLGYTWDITWGGNRAIASKPGQAVPGARMTLAYGDVDGFLGIKTSLVDDPAPRQDGTEPEQPAVAESDVYYGVLGGFGFDFADALRFDLGGGFFQRGKNPMINAYGLEKWATGLSTRLVFYRNADVGTSSEFGLYTNDPLNPRRWMSHPEVAVKPSLTAQVELSYVTQALASPDKVGETVLQPGLAGNVIVRGASGALSGSLNLFVRSPSFILFDVPSFTPNMDFPEESETSNDVFAALGAQYVVPALHLSAGLIAGVQFPATFKGLIPGSAGVADAGGGRTVVIRDEGMVSILPEGEDPLPVAVGKLALRHGLSESMAAVLEVVFVNDPNQTLVTLSSNRDGQANPTRGYAPVQQKLAAGLHLLARF